jgi:hypothetical protein
VFYLKKFKFLIVVTLIFLTGCTSLYRDGHYPEKLSKNFTLSQAIKPGTDITPEIYKNLQYAADRMEDYLDELDDSVTVISWYRSPAHNSTSGGAENSAHLYGLAVDFRANSTKDQRLIFNKLVKSGPFLL